MSKSKQSPAFGRLGWLITTLVLALALVLSSWMSLRGARKAASTVTNGQANLMDAAFRAAVRPTMNTAETQAALEEFVTAQSEAGVRYVALLNPNGSVQASAGEPATPAALPPLDSTVRMPGQIIVPVGERVRSYSMRPFPRNDSTFRRGRGGPGTPGDRSPEFRGERGPRGDGSPEGRDDRGRNAQGPRQGFIPHMNLIEFEPVIARGLVTRAESSMLISFVGATILALAALLFWRTSEQYERAQRKLEQQKRLTVLGEMSAVLAHEIRNPLALLKGNAQLLAERIPADSRERARADRVILEATRLETLTSDLLDFARTGPIDLQPSDPVGVLRTSVADIDEHGFVVDTTDAPAQWVMDANRVRHALVNVLQNAKQASPNGQLPHVRVKQEKGNLVYEIRDFGTGLPDSGDERIFDPFYTTRTNGTGLGLAVARRVAELHNGRISAQNHAEGGAVFRIELPASN